MGNDFARTLSLPVGWEKACHTLVEARVGKVDVGVANGRCFVNATGVGFDAAVAREVASLNARVGGIWLYLFAVLKMLFRFKRGAIEMTFNGSQISTRAWLVAVTNGPTYGGGMRICPRARTDDGLLNFCIIGDISLWRVFYYLPLVILGKHLALPEVYSGRAARIRLKTPGYYSFHMEGEVLQSSELEISLQPGALKVIC
jgi:diacylglycerol kinase family enzyme